MKEDLLKFIRSNELSPFSASKAQIKRENNSVYKTSDAKKVHRLVIGLLSRKFNFAQTVNIWDYFNFTSEIQTILGRQEFFKSVPKSSRDYLKKLKTPRKSWSPDYNIVVVTEDESTFIELQKLSCPVQLLINEDEVMELEKYDVVQMIDCETYGGVISRLPQSLPLHNIEDAYLERYLEMLSAWKENFLNIKDHVSGELKEVLSELSELFALIDHEKNKIITTEEVENITEDINDKVNSRLRELTLSGDSLVRMLSEGKIPEEIETIIQKELEKTGLPGNIFNVKVPVEIDYSELEKYIHLESATEFTNLSEKIKLSAGKLKQVPRYIRELESLIVLEDFYSGIANYLSVQLVYPSLSDNLHFSGAKNLFLSSPQPIDFQLDNFSRCSILTGANSGGKTTLIEHLIQNISLFQLGLPIAGEIHSPLFTDIYYFAKNKGSASKGAFETLLTQMSQIKNGKQVLILADEIESVTEPGVAGKIISATAEYFLSQNCFLVIATHLGHEIKECLPEGARIDGIEAKGLDENFNLIVDHNPVMGRLAHSTPELIVEKMANSNPEEYFKFLFDRIKKEKKD
jgi:DNA mismatch repair protein MutS2